jgi:hypothetical protein
MTREELILYGKDYLHDLETACCKIEEKHKEFVRESIKALEQETVPREHYESEYLARKQAEYELWKIKEQQPCEDCVSRQALINAFPISDTYTLDDIIATIKFQPPVTPTQRWIPVSERLPEDGRPVLIYAWNVHHVVARYDSFRTEDGYKKCWVTADSWNGNTEIKNEVIEWMPLPEPYKTESEEK